MNKRITSIVLSLVMLFTMLATAVPVLAATPVELKVTADTTSANPGDTINYKVSVGAVTDMGGLEFKLDIPSGLTVVDGSISIPDGLETIIDSDGPIIVPTSSNSYYWLYSAQLTGYTGTSDLVILTFSCKVDDGTTGTKTVSIKEVVLIDQSVDDMPFNVTGADVNVTTPHVHVYDKEVATEGYLKTGATCTEAAVYYKSCECGAKGTETFTSGSALDHDYTKKVENNTYLKTAASNCTEYNVYWYACSRCDANAKDDAEATDKYYTSTTAGNHSFTEQIEDTAHYVAGTGTDCQSVKKYYYDCAYCDLIGTNTWDSTTYGLHNYAATWSSDADGHWHECSLCHDKKDNAAHTPGAAATETTPQKCTECDYIITPALGHTHHMTPVAANPATCTEDGNKAYYVCSGCSKWFEDATGSVEITDHSSVVLGQLGHDWKDATCTAPKTCQRDGCGATEGEPNGHTEGTDWKNDANYHWHICSVDGCGAVIESSKAAHTPDREAATETEPVKCSECDYIIEEQLAPRTPITNIAATITAPELGATPDYNPVFTFTPAGCVELSDITWYKIAIDEFTGTDEDIWDEMESDETFTTGYYYSVDMHFNPNDGFKLTESTTGTVNGKPHDNTYGDLFEEEFSYYFGAYLSGLFEPLTKEYIIDLPVSIAVKLTGDEKPGKETFKFEIYDLGYEDTEFEILNDTVVAENVEFDENGVAFLYGFIKIKVVGEEQLFNLTEGFNVRMVKGSTKGWTYAPEQWCVELFFENDALDVNIGVKEIVDGEISEVYANNMNFTVGYEAVAEPEPGDPQNPPTSDAMTTIWLSMLLVSGAGILWIAKTRKSDSVSE